MLSDPSIKGKEEKSLKAKSRVNISPQFFFLPLSAGGVDVAVSTLQTSHTLI